MVRSGARLGSALTFSSARFTSARSGGGGPAAQSGVAVANSSSAAVRTLSLEGTPQFLLNVPRFQLRAPVQIHRKSSSHVEWFEKEDD